MKTVDKILQKHLITAIGKKNAHKIADNALFLEDLGMNSMLLISFFTNVIDELKVSIIEFSDTELTEIRSVLDLKTALYSKYSK
ncbi:MAG: hypothetical protein QE487_03685 [Fluviicola sp.]|nr:hypothetical protein [Fluviicola sp.]